MKTLLTLLLVSASIIYLAGIELSFKPFKVKINSPYLCVGWIITCIGVSVLFHHYEKKGYKQGVKDIIEEIKEYNNNAANNCS